MTSLAVLKNSNPLVGRFIELVEADIGKGTWYKGDAQWRIFLDAHWSGKWLVPGRVYTDWCLARFAGEPFRYSGI